MEKKEHFTNGRTWTFGTGLSLMGLSFGAQTSGWNHWVSIGFGYGSGFVLVFLSAIWITKSYYSREERKEEESKKSGPFFFTERLPPQQELIMNKFFANETVEIDGKHFMGCTFVNVKIKYNGTSNFSFTNVKFEGYPFVATDNPGVESSYMLLKALGMINAPLLHNGVPMAMDMKVVNHGKPSEGKPSDPVS